MFSLSLRLPSPSPVTMCLTVFVLGMICAAYLRSTDKLMAPSSHEPIFALLYDNKRKGIAHINPVDISIIINQIVSFHFHLDFSCVDSFESVFRGQNLKAMIATLNNKI